MLGLGYGADALAGFLVGLWLVSILELTPVALMNGEQLVALLVEHDIGIARISYDLIELAQLDKAQRNRSEG